MLQFKMTKIFIKGAGDVKGKHKIQPEKYEHKDM